jgi:hypothetical protein
VHKYSYAVQIFDEFSLLCRHEINEEKFKVIDIFSIILIKSSFYAYVTSLLADVGVCFLITN